MVIGVILGIVYLLSPIPLLILFISKNNEAKNLLDLYRKEREKNNKLTAELKNAKSSNTENDIKNLSEPAPVNATVPSAKAVKTVQQSEEVKHRRDKKLKDLIDTSNTGLVLTVGVILVLLASVGFMSATWSFLSTGIRALFLLSFSAIFLAAGIFAKTKLDLPSTALAFYSIGSAALPITIIGASAFELLGKNFGIHGATGHYTFAVAFASLMLLTAFGAAFFKSRVFAFTSLSCITSIIISLVTVKDWSYNLDVVFFVLCATAITVTAPFIKRITKNTVLSSIGAIADSFAIFNHYALTVCALVCSEQELISGIFIILLGVGFLIGSFHNTKYNLLSLPHILLILLGSRQIINTDSETAVAAWLLFVGVYFITLSFIKLIKKPLSQILFATGLVLTFISAFSLCIEVNNYDFTWLFVPQTLIAIAVFIFCGIFKKKNYLSFPAILLFEIMLISLSHCQDISIVILDLLVFAANLTALVLFSLIKKNPLYCSGSEFLLGFTTILSAIIFLVDNSIRFVGGCILLTVVLMALAVFLQYLCQHKDNWLKYFYSIVWVLVPSIALLAVTDYNSIYTSVTLIVTSVVFSLFAIGHFDSNKKIVIISFHAALSMVYINVLFTFIENSYLNAFTVINTVIPLLLSSCLLFNEIKINGYTTRKAAWLSGLTAITLPSVFLVLFCAYYNNKINTGLYNDVALPYALTSLAETVFLFIMQMRNKDSDSRITFIKENFKGVHAGILVSALIQSPALISLKYFRSYRGTEVTLFIGILFILMMTLWAFLYRYEIKVLSGIATLWASYTFAELFQAEYRIPVLLIPVLLFAIAVAFERKRSVTKDPIFYGISAVSTLMLFSDSYRNIYALAAFVIIEIAYFIRSTSKENKTRAISLLAVTLSAVVWFRLPFSPYNKITDIIQLKLLPITLFFMLMPSIITRLNEHHDLSVRIRIIYGYILMAILAGIAIDSGKMSDRLVYAVICIVILVAGFFFHSRQTVLLGAVSTAFLVIYLIGQIFGSKAWLIYLAVSGTVLITVAVRNEIKRRKQT